MDSPAQPVPAAAGDLGALITSVKAIIGDWAGLFALESRLAGLSASRMLAFAIIAGLALFTAWLLLLGSVLALLLTLGYSLPILLAVAAGLNLLAAILLVLAIRNLSGNLLFTETRKSLKPRVQLDTQSDDPIAT